MDLPPPPTPRLAKMRRLARLANVTLLIVPSAVLWGWLFNIDALTRIVPGLVQMNPVAAINFILAGSAVGSALNGHAARARRVAATVLGLTGGLVLCRYVFGWDAKVDQFLFSSSLRGNVMAPTTAFAFVLSALALALFERKSRGDRFPAQWFAVGAGIVALIALTGYAYQVEKLYRLGSFIAMALHTAAMFLVFAIGLLCTRPDRGLIARWCSDGPGGAMLRRLLLAIVGVPLLLGWLATNGQRSGRLEPAFGFTILAVGTVVFLAVMIWRNAISLDEKDAARGRAEADLRRVHLGLETAVHERTIEVRQVLAAICEGVVVLGSAAEQILASTSELAATASESATSVSHTTGNVEAVRQAAHASSDEAQRVASSSQAAVEISRVGKSATEATITGMDRIQREMQSIAESMLKLSDQSHAIGEIVAAVDQLSEQSNLLAVNAAIQAASAGAHGKGFAVVADEMKYLSRQSQEATKQVRAILGEIQSATSAAVMTTEQAAKAVAYGVQESAEAGRSIVALAEHLDGASRSATQIADSSQRQLTGMDRMALAMEQIKEASVHSAEQARQLEQSARGLNNLGLRLKQLTEQHQAETRA